MRKIAIAGTGYVGFSNGILLAQNNQVLALDVVPEKVALLNRNEFPVVDEDIQDYFKHKQLNFSAILDKEQAYQNADFVIIATPTDYDPIHKFGNFSLVNAEFCQFYPTHLLVN